MPNIPKYSRWGQNARRWSRKEMSVQNSLHTGKRSNWCNNLIHSPAKRLQNAKSSKIEWTSLLNYIFSFVQQFSIFKIDIYCSVKFSKAQHEVFSALFYVEMGKSSLTVWGGFWSISKRGWVWKRFGNMRFDHLDHCDRSNHQAGRSYHLPNTKFMLKCIFSAVGPTWKGTLKNVLSIW